MKKTNHSFSNIREMLSRDQMKLIIGGYDTPPGYGTCTATVKCSDTVTITCTSDPGEYCNQGTTFVNCGGGTTFCPS